MILALAGLVVALYLETFSSMASVWQSSAYRHGAIVFPLSAYLLWRMRASFGEVELRPCVWGLAPIAMLVGLWLLARAVGVQLAEHFAAVALIPATVLAFLGWSLMRQVMFPLLFLIAAVPVGDALVPYLMLFTADVSTFLLQAVGVPVFREGQFLTLPGGDFEVAEVCAGLSYLTAGTMISLLFAYFTYRSLTKRSVFVAVVALVVILANGVRAFIVMFVASATDMQYLAGRDHVLFGWLLFAVVLMGLVFAGSRYADDTEPATRRGYDGEVPAPDELAQRGRRSLLPLALVLGLVVLAAIAQPMHAELGASWIWLWPAAGLMIWALYRRFGSGGAGDKGVRALFDAAAAPYNRAASYRRAGGVVVVCVVPAILAAGPTMLSESRAARTSETRIVQLPPSRACGQPGGWSGDWRPNFNLPDVALTGSYQCLGGAVDVQIVRYENNAQDQELVNRKHRLIPETGRSSPVPDVARFESAGGRTIEVNEVRVSRGASSSSLVWYWYEVGGRAVRAPHSAKLTQALQLVLHGRTDGSAYVLRTPIDDSLAESRRRLQLIARELDGATIAIDDGGRS